MRYLFIPIFFLSTNLSYSQELKVGFGYSNLYSKQFDESIQTYNFSRPFLDEKQPLLNNGMNGSLSYLFKSKKQIKQGISANYSFFRSKAENANLDVKFAFNLFEFGYFLHFADKDKFGNFYSEFGINAVVGMLNKNLNQEPFIVDDTKVRSIQLGGTLNLDVGYQFKIGDKLNISPIVGVHFSPYFSSGRSEAVINQTTGLISKQYTSFWKIDFGIRFHLQKKCT